MQVVEFLGCLLRITPDKVRSGRPPEDRLHHAIRSLVLPDYDIRLEKCRCHFSALHAEMPPQATRQKFPRLCRRYCGEDGEAWYPLGRSQRNLSEFAPVLDQAQPGEVRVRSTSQPAPWLPGLRTRHRVQPCEDQGHREDGSPPPTVRCAKVHRLLGVHQPIHQSAGREGSSPVLAHEEDHFF